MTKRRKRRDQKNHELFESFDLRTISLVLKILIIITLIIFIISSLKLKSEINSLKREYSNTNRNLIIDTNSTDTEIAKDLNSQNIVPDEIIYEEENKPSGQQKEINIHMAFTGDIMCHNTIYNDAYNTDLAEYDFSYIFENIKYHLQTPDITIGNLETTFAGSEKKYSSYPTFNTPEALAYNLKKVGFDVLSTANNHCYDSGYAGIESTINYLDDADISHTGTYTSPEEQNKILIKNVKGIKIAFLSFTYGTNGIHIPEDRKYSVNLNDRATILNQLNLAKNQNPDLICASIHWGIEYQTNPNSEQKELADFLLKNGTDIIIGNHPHVLQPIEKNTVILDDGTSKEGFVIYSLGNFIADQNKANTRCSAIVNLSVTKSADQKIHINNWTYTPIYTYKNQALKVHKFQIFDLKNTIAAYDAGYTDGITINMYNTFKNELSNIQKVLGF